MIRQTAFGTLFSVHYIRGQNHNNKVDNKEIRMIDSHQLAFNIHLWHLPMFFLSTPFAKLVMHLNSTVILIKFRRLKLALLELYLSVNLTRFCSVWLCLSFQFILSTFIRKLKPTFLDN